MALGLSETSQLVAAGIVARTVAVRLWSDPGCGVDGLPVDVHEGGNGRRDRALHALPSGFSIAELDHRFHPCSFDSCPHCPFVSVPDFSP